jgi:tryptophan-rich sensory protein
MTFLQEVIGFFLWVGGTYAVGAAVAIYIYFKAGALTYRMGRASKESAHPSAPDIWYLKLKKNNFTPGTFGYGIGWGIGYLCFGYAVWRVYIAGAARESALGTGVVSVAIVHWAALVGSAYLTFGTESLIIGAVGQLLSLATSATVTALIWKLHVDGVAALIGAGISASIYTFIVLLALIVHMGLLVRNGGCKSKSKSASV